MIVVLVSGYATSGKDTFSDFVVEHADGAKKYALAYELKEIAAKYFGWDGKKDERGRNLLIGIGRVGREYNINIWVDKTIERIKAEKPKVAVVSDWRFKNEFVRMVEAFGRDSIVTVRIVRNGVSIINDRSELDLNDFTDYDYIIDNNGTLVDLEDKVKKFVCTVLACRCKADTGVG